MDYICGYCGKAYPTVGERMECEKKCYEKKIQEEENLKASKREEEMKKDSDNIMALVKERDGLAAKISDMVKEYDKKYGVFTTAELTPWLSPFERFFRL